MCLIKYKKLFYFFILVPDVKYSFLSDQVANISLSHLTMPTHPTPHSPLFPLPMAAPRSPNLLSPPQHKVVVVHVMETKDKNVVEQGASCHSEKI